MLGIWSEYADIFLLSFSVLILIAFAVPMLFVPLRWAAVIGFRLPHHTDLAVYYGRSLGVAIIAISAICISAYRFPAARPVVFDGLIIASALYLCTHVYGAIKKIQPLAETLEIAFWILLLLLTIAIYPVGMNSGLLG